MPSPRTAATRTSRSYSVPTETSRNGGSGRRLTTQMVRGPPDWGSAMNNVLTDRGIASPWMQPARRGKRSSNNPNALPEGAHLRLSPALNTPSLHLAPTVTMIAEPAQKCGIVLVRIVTYSSTVVYANRPFPGRPNPMTPQPADKDISRALAAFPWRQLQVLAAPICRSWSRCSATPSAVLNVAGNVTVGSIVTLDNSNSTLTYPRTQVQWDHTGNGSYNVPGGTGVSITLPLPTGGPHTVAVRITTAHGTVVTRATPFVVVAASAAAGLASITLTASSLAFRGASSSPWTHAPSRAIRTPLGTLASTSDAKPVCTSAVGPRRPFARPTAQAQASSAGGRKNSAPRARRNVRRSRRSPGRRWAMSRRTGKSRRETPLGVLGPIADRPQSLGSCFDDHEIASC